MDESELRRLEVNFDKDEFILFGEMIDQWINNQFEGIKKDVNILNDKDRDLMYYEVQYTLDNEVIFRYGTLAKVIDYGEENYN